jgi:PDZ domain-containing protein
VRPRLKRLLSPFSLLVLGLAVLAAAFVAYVAPSSDYIFLPDKAHPVAPLVTVQGGHDRSASEGSIYFVDVIVRKASFLEKLFGGLHKGADLYPASAVNDGVSDSARQQIDIEDMQRSQEIAAAVALKALGRKVVIRSDGVLVDQVGEKDPAGGRLRPDDVITAVDGKAVRGTARLQKLMRKHRIGDTVTFTVRRGKATLKIPVPTIASPPPRHPVVGIVVEDDVDIQLPLKVRIDAGNVGGPSAGLAFALEVMQQLGRDVTHGHSVAATGELTADGAVEPIGGIKQKTIGVREAGADVFLVPAGDNAAEARKEAGGLRIIPVKTFPQALHALATLPPPQ